MNQDRWTMVAAPLIGGALMVALVGGSGMGGSPSAGQDLVVPAVAGLSPALEAADVGLGVQGYEPTLTITPSGAILVVVGRPGHTEPPLYVTGVPGEMWVMASSDQGATWTNVTPSTGAGEIIDPFITSDPLTGRVYRAAYQSASVGGNGCIDLIWSDDDGQSWEHNAMACGIHPVAHDHESLATGVPRNALLPMLGYPNVLYLCVNKAEGSSCTTSRDGGRTFGLFVDVFPSVSPQGQRWCGGLHAPVVTDSEGRVFLPRTYCGVPTIARSVDEGLTWERTVISEDHPPAPSSLLSVGGVDLPYIDVQDVMVQSDAANNLHAAWVAADGMVWVASSTDHGATWGDAWMVDVPGVTAVASKQFSIAAGAAGKLAFAFAATDHPGGYAGNPTGADWEGATWDLYLAVTEDAFAVDPTVEAVRVNDAGDPVGVDDCGLHRCSPCELQDCGGWFDYLDVDVDASGRPWAIYIDSCHEACHGSGEIDRPEARVATLTSGPALTAAGGALAPLPWA